MCGNTHDTHTRPAHYRHDTQRQVVNVSLPGSGVPALMEAREDTRLLAAELGGRAGEGLV
jgi:hypothetical protein